MTHACPACADTGSLSKDIEGQLDCAACTIANERYALEKWALANGIRCSSGADLWRIYCHGRAVSIETVKTSRDELLEGMATAAIALAATVKKLGWSDEKINGDELLQNLRDIGKRAMDAKEKEAS